MKELLLKSYNLPPSISVTLLSHNDRNDVYEIVDNGSVFYFKVFTQYSESRIEHEFRFINLLNKNNILSPIPVLAIHGISYVHLEKEKKIGILYPRVVGKSIDAQIEDLSYYKIGKIIGRIHAAFDKMPDDLCNIYWSNYWLIDKPMEIITKIGSDDQGKIDCLVEIVSSIKSSLAKILQPRLPEYGIIHADLHGGNVFLGENEEVALIDFESFGFGYRYYDLVRFLYPEICACLDIEQVTNNKITEFFDGYVAERTSMSINMKAFNLFAIINIIRALASHIESGKYRTRDAEFENELDDRIKKMQRYIAMSKCFE